MFLLWIALALIAVLVRADLAYTLDRIPLSQLDGDQSCDGERVWIKLFFLGDQDYTKTTSRIIYPSSPSIDISPSRNYSICTDKTSSFLFYRDPFRLANGNVTILTNGEIFATLSANNYAAQTSESISSFLGIDIIAVPTLQTSFPTLSPSAAPISSPSIAPTLYPTNTCDSPSSIFRVRINPDTAAASETSWNLFELDGGVGSSLFKGTDSFDTCLSPGHYIFEIADCGLNGLCCDNGEGSYQVYIDGSLIQSGAEFQLTETTLFQIQ